MSEIVLLNGTNVYYIDNTSASSVLALADYLNDATTVLTGFNSAAHTLAYSSGADDIRALGILHDAGGYAVWPVYEVPAAGGLETVVGYVTITDASGIVSTVSANAIGSGTTTNAAFVEILISYFTSTASGAYETPTEVITAITSAKDKTRFEIA
jgi:hypothetical protein